MKFGVGVICWVFLIFLFFMGIEEVRELSLKVCYVGVVYGRFFYGCLCGMGGFGLGWLKR